jgi:hypothetical protein
MPRKFATDRTDPHFAMYWVTDGPFPKLLSEVVMFAHRENFISADDLPDRSDREDDWMAEAAAVDRLLTERGAWDAWRRQLVSAAFAARCPFWCHGRHEPLGRSGDPVVHILPVASRPRGDGQDFEVCILAYEDADGVGRPEVESVGFDDFAPTGEDVVFLAEATLQGVAVLDEIKRQDGAR